LLFLSQAVGPLTASGAAAMLVRLRAALAERGGEPATLEEALRALRAEQPRLPGLGVPFRPVDERLVALRARVEARGRANGAYWQLFERVDAASPHAFGVRPNISMAFAAVMLDLGIAPEQIGLLGVVLMAPNFVAVTWEAARRRSPLLQKLPDERVAYIGRPPRESTRMRAAQTRQDEGAPGGPRTG
jgi:hypothetical protein